MPAKPATPGTLPQLRKRLDEDREPGRLVLLRFLRTGVRWIVDVVGTTRSRTTRAALLVVTTLFSMVCVAGPNNGAPVDAPHIAGFWLGELEPVFALLADVEAECQAIRDAARGRASSVGVSAYVLVVSRALAVLT